MFPQPPLLITDARSVPAALSAHLAVDLLGPRPQPGPFVQLAEDLHTNEDLLAPRNQKSAPPRRFSSVATSASDAGGVCVRASVHADPEASAADIDASTGSSRPCSVEC